MSYMEIYPTDIDAFYQALCSRTEMDLNTETYKG